jgi:hypothetical protein
MTGAQALQSWAQDGLNVNEEAVQDLADQRKEMDDWIYKMHGDDKSLGVRWLPARSAPARAHSLGARL